MMSALLILHMLVGVFLLGAISHQLVAVLRRRPAGAKSFVDRYASVNQRVFTPVVLGLYLAAVVLGAVIYPKYRLDVRTAFEELQLGWAVGLFEAKEHFAGIGLGILPLYGWLWRSENFEARRRDRIAITAILAFIVWWDFLIGHILNNIRGFG